VHPSVTTSAQAPAQISTQAHWLGEPDARLLSWVTCAREAPGCPSSAVLILPSIGYEYWSAQRSLRVLAEALAGAGHLAMRLDYSGTGDSSGQQWDGDTLARWRRDVHTAVQALREMGARTITLVGLRIGATLALDLADEVQAQAVVFWVGVSAGRRLVKELQLLSIAAPASATAIGGEGTRCMAGSLFTAPMLADIASLSTDDVQTSARVLVLDRPDKGSNQKMVEQLAARGVPVTRQVLAGAELMLDLPTEYATVPTAHVQAIVEWVGPAPASSAGQCLPVCTPSTALPWTDPDGGRHQLTESVLRLGARDWVGVETLSSTFQGGATVVLFNTGSEPHVGPGRAWVEIARGLAARGSRVIRADFRGWGESPDDGHAPGRPYDAHAVDDVRGIIDALVERGDRHIVLVGLCAGAWAALRRCGDLPVAATVALNPQLFWQPGDRVFATIPEDLGWRESETASNPAWAAATRAAVRQWLLAIRDAPYPVDFWFSPGDYGLKYIHHAMGDDMPGLMGGALHIHDYVQLDHAMHLQWHRHEAVEAIQGRVDQILGRTI
jgi:alpha-beta hydrolase superfamily lysophospholipase